MQLTVSISNISLHIMIIIFFRIVECLLSLVKQDILSIDGPYHTHLLSFFHIRSFLKAPFVLTLMVLVEASFLNMFNACECYRKIYFLFKSGFLCITCQVDYI